MKTIKKIGCILLISLFFIGCKKEVKPIKKQRPNIVFILADDQRNDVLSIAGHPIVQTPTIDKLAQNGMRFTNAFVTTSICAASRASIFTGLYESKHNFTFGKDPIKQEYTKNSYPFLLKKEGYHTGFVGKFGVKIEAKDSLISQLFDYFKPAPQNAPYFKELADGTRRHSAEIKGDQAIEFINQQNQDQPFCLSISFNAVHAVDGNLTPGNEGHYPYPKAVEHLYEGMEMPAPLLSDSKIFENHPDFLKTSMNRVRYHWRWDTEEKYQVNIKAYYRMISGYDRVIQRVLDALKAKGLDENTIIIYTADNGYYMGNRGFAGKWSHYEESLRVPMVIYDPRKPAKDRGKTSNQMALNIDMAATILDYAGVKIPTSYQGKSLTPIVNNSLEDAWRNNFMIEHQMVHPQIPKYVGIRNKQYVYANYYEQNPPYEYLHDLETDPDQLVNLVEDQNYQEVLEEMRGENLRLEKEIKN
jgi:arylsulfatase A-like enzyme